MKKTVLITGAYGFIGRYVALEYAKKGFCVIGIGHSAWLKDEFKKWGITKFYNDDINIENLKNISLENSIDVIIHCAGGSSVSLSFKYPEVDFKKTVNSTLSVLEFIRIYSNRTILIFLSSAAVYGETGLDNINEDTILNPVSPYGFNKKIAEEICQMYSRVYSIKIIILRLFSIYGNELKKQLLWDACNKISINKNIFFGTGNEIRDWMHIKDLTKYILYAGTYLNERFAIYNIGSGKGESINKILKILFNKFGVNEEPVFNNIIDIGNPLKYVANVDKIKKWNIDRDIEIEKGIEDYVKWYKENGKY